MSKKDFEKLEFKKKYLKYKSKYLKYKSKYLNLKKRLFTQKYVKVSPSKTEETFDGFCTTIYSNPSVPINKLLINLQRNDDLGYFAPKCLELDPEPNPYYTSFASGLGFQTFNYSTGQMTKPIEYLVMVKNIFGEIIRDFNHNDTTIEYAKKNIGLTILLANCVVRIVPMKTYLKLKTLYDALLLDRSGDNLKWDNFERIYRIYMIEHFEMVIIVSEKLEPIKDSMTMEIKPKFTGLEKEIVETVRANRNYLHQIGIVHGDLSLDNTGFRASDNKFVIFDFDGSYVKANPKPSDDKVRGWEHLDKN